MFDYKDWLEKHSQLVQSVNRACDLNNKFDSNKCASATAVMNFSMQDINGFFQNQDHKTATADLCFLIRNIDVIITSILDLNHELLGIGLNKQQKALEKCFNNPKIISDFRTLRSLILAHPVDTNFINNDGIQETVFLEDILPTSSMDAMIGLSGHDYTLRMCSPNTKASHFKPLFMNKDIIPVINEIIAGMHLLTQKLNVLINECETKLRNIPLVIDNSSIINYILSLDKELKIRYPDCIDDTEYEDGNIKHWSIIYDCLDYFNVSFTETTQIKYDEFLQYIRNELNRIENDLQQMTYDEDEGQYFELCHNSNFAENEHYAKEKMLYLKHSDKTSFTTDDIPNTTPSNALWGVQQFKILIPYIEQYIPVDLSVSDKGLYCEYLAANYLSNIIKE